MRSRRVKKAIKKQGRLVAARLRGESTEYLPKITWRERRAMAASAAFAETHNRQGTAMPPEVLFHRYFRSRPHLLRDGYRGKVDLDRLVSTTLPIALLHDVQRMLNEALLHENTNIPEHVDHDPFHCDYLDSDEPNALAFCADGHSFIGLTIPLLDALWTAATRLSESSEIQTLLRVRLTAEAAEMTVPQRLQIVVFRIQLFFIVLHEFSHVVHGHVRRGVDSAFSNEVLTQNDGGSIGKQGRESTADGYAIYFLLAAIFDNAQERRHLLRLLGQDESSEAEQDEVLLTAFIIAAAAFTFLQASQSLWGRDVYTRTHPLHAARLALMMKAANAWCDQNRKKLGAATKGDPFRTVAADCIVIGRDIIAADPRITERQANRFVCAGGRAGDSMLAASGW